MLRPGEVLEYVPGVIITSTAATARRTSISCAASISITHRLPHHDRPHAVNMPTHAHGQGYSDLNFLLPELVSRVAYKKVRISPRKATFPRGAADIDYYTKMPKGVASLGLGSNGYRRAMAANSFDAAGPSALRLRAVPQRRPVGESRGLPQVERRAALQPGNERGRLHRVPHGYTGKWNATDQIPQRAVDDGTIHASARSIRPTAARPRATACRSTGTRHSRTARCSTWTCTRSSTG